MFDINIAIYQLEVKQPRSQGLSFVKLTFRDRCGCNNLIPFHNGDSSLAAIFKSGETLGTGLR